MSATTNPSASLQRTPLYELHVSLGAKMVPFAGYEMPVQYPLGILKEHLHTRASAGLFDVSHMGQAVLAGPDHATTAAALEALVPADIVEPGTRAAALHPAPERRRRHHRRPDGDTLRLRGRRRQPDAGGECVAQGGGLCPHRGAATRRCAPAAGARTRPAGAAGAGRQGCAGKAVGCGCRPEVHERRPAARSASSTATSRARATPARTASRFRWPPPRRRSWRGCCWRRRACSRSASAHATRCGWRRACASTATTSTR